MSRCPELKIRIEELEAEVESLRRDRTVLEPQITTTLQWAAELVNENKGLRDEKNELRDEIKRLRSLNKDSGK